MTFSFRTILVPAIIGIFGAVILASLGVWQLHRLEWKEALIAQREADLDGTPINLAGYIKDPQIDKEIIPFVDEGIFGEGATDILSGNKDGAGYRRIVTANIDGTRIMVEAGFLPESQKHAPYSLPKGEYPIDGHVFHSQGRIGSYDANRDVWVGYDIKKMAQQLDTIPLIVALREAPVDEWSDTPVTVDLPNSHLGYAIQWFGLALVWIGMAFYWGYRRTKKGE